MIKPYADVGINWWVESVDPWRWGQRWELPISPEAVEQMETRIRQGPPKG